MGTSYALFAPILLAFGLLLMPLRPESAMLLDEDRQTMIAVVLTSVLFAYIHQAQLANSWGAVVPILLVGLIITTIRVRLNSVAAGWILHCGYNGTLFLIMWAGFSAVRKVS
jgi:membrane protease YdiL (CAAX protease family)